MYRSRSTDIARLDRPSAYGEQTILPVKKTTKTKSMYRDGNRSNFRSSRFTAHAAFQLHQRYNKSASRCYDETGYQLSDDLSHEDCEHLKRLVHNTFPKCNINLIHRVNASQMYGMYLLRKEEMELTSRSLVQEIILYHVTSKSRAIKSLKSGLDWRFTRRSKFGRGVSFSDNADYANYYADKFSKEDSRVIIVCTVLVNKTHPVSGKRNEEDLIVPPDTADTTVSTNGRVYVKYNDYDFYPLYFIHYKRTPELLNESKYIRNNLHNRWPQNPWVTQQEERERAQCQRELQAQRELEQTRRQQELRPQHYLDQKQVRRLQVQEELRRLQVQEELRRLQVLEQERQQNQTLQHESNKSFCLIL